MFIHQEKKMQEMTKLPTWALAFGGMRFAATRYAQATMTDF
jgi:hypothetical protein